MKKKYCKKFRKGLDGFCVYYRGSRKNIESCISKCAHGKIKIKLLDKTLKNKGLDISKEYSVIRIEIKEDDLFYIVKNKDKKECAVIDGLAEEIV